MTLQQAIQSNRELDLQIALDSARDADDFAAKFTDQATIATDPADIEYLLSCAELYEQDAEDFREEAAKLKALITPKVIICWPLHRRGFDSVDFGD